jgi:5'-3' exonuclease
LYYYSSVPSWDWFYPFHYSPFLTDIDVPEENTIFEQGRPFKPFEQLMSVFPQKTYYALPQCVQHLMLDINSPICDYFP